MADKSSIIKAFNTHFFDFLDDIIIIFPENQDIRNSRASFEIFRKANPTSILKVWNIFIYKPYHDVIEAGNIDFFFEKSYNNDLSHLANANEIMQIIDTLRNPLKDMSDVNKAHSVKYMQNLSKLSQMYIQHI